MQIITNSPKMGAHFPSTSRWIICLCVAFVALAAKAQAQPRPNILLLMGDNWQYDHAGANGDPVVKTPVFDRIAREGARFTHTFCPVPSCGPARASLFTGRAAHQLEDSANMLASFDGKKFRVFTDALAENGYHVGFTGKAWGQGSSAPYNRPSNPAGEQFSDFADFLAARKAGQPFFFWHGSVHTALGNLKDGEGARHGIDPAKVKVPGYLPDAPIVREEIADYLAAVQKMDAVFEEAIALLEQTGELDNTVVIYTSDNGWQMPRGLANVYDAGTREPMAVRWPGKVRPGRVIDDFISLTDLAPTFLELAGLEPWAEMTGRSFVDVLAGKPAAPVRDCVFLERERHANVRRGDLSYPIRAIRTKDHLYLRNLRPDRWPAGDPQMYWSVGDYGDADNSHTKYYMIEHRNDPAMRRLFRLAFEKRPAEELYDLRKDPDQLTNLADKPELAEIKRQLGARLDTWMKQTDDPRLDPSYDEFDRYPYFSPRRGSDWPARQFEKRRTVE